MCMSEQTGKTTVEVTYDVWAALDKRKDRGDSFNDVIKRLIDNSAVEMGQLKGVDQEIETKDVVEISAENAKDHSCAHADPVTGEMCDETPSYEQEYRHAGAEEWSTFYYCEEHKPDERPEVANE